MIGNKHSLGMAFVEKYFKRVRLFDSCEFSGVYVLFGGKGTTIWNNVAYVGSSVNIQQRLKGNHHAYDPDSHQVMVLNTQKITICKDDGRAVSKEDIEDMLIDYLQPCLNKVKRSPRVCINPEALGDDL